MTLSSTLASRRSRMRGVGLLDGLIALVILGFGLLAMTQFQTKLIAQSTEAQQRMTAMQLGDELLSTVLVDAANAACYTLPQAGACASATAQARAAEWKVRALAALPGAPTAGSVLDAGTSRLTVTVTWTGKHTQETRTVQMATDVRQ